MDFPGPQVPLLERERLSDNERVCLASSCVTIENCIHHPGEGEVIDFFVALEKNQPQRPSKHTNQLVPDWPPGPREIAPPCRGQGPVRLFAKLPREALISKSALGFKAKQPLLATESFKRRALRQRRGH